MMKRVYVCAELGEKENLEQMKEYSRYVLMRGAAPVVPHFYLLCLDDSDPKEREIKQAAGLNLLWICDEAWIFGSTVTEGMKAEIQFCKSLNITIRVVQKEEMQRVLGGCS